MTEEKGYAHRAFRLPRATLQQMEELAEKMGMTKTTTLILAIDHYYQEKKYSHLNNLPKERKQAKNE